MDIKLMPEKYKRKEKQLTGLSATLLSRLITRANLWLMLSLIFLGLVALTYFGLWGYKNSLAKEKEDLESRFEELAGQRNLELEANFMELSLFAEHSSIIFLNNFISINPFFIL